MKEVSTKQYKQMLKKSHQTNIASLLHKCGIDNLTAITLNTNDNCSSQAKEDNDSLNIVVPENDDTIKVKKIKTAIADDSECDESESDNSIEKDYVSCKEKMLQEEIIKLNENNKVHVAMIEVMKNNALQSDDDWKSRYNDVQQQNEKLNEKIKVLTDLNVNLQVQLNSLKEEKETHSFPKDTPNSNLSEDEPNLVNIILMF